MSGSGSGTLSPNNVPGKLHHDDRVIVAHGFNALRNRNPSPQTSGLRIVDTLDSRFVFTVSHPGNVSVSKLKSLCLKLKNTRQVLLDLPRSSISVECWRTNWKSNSRGRKRRRPAVEEVTSLPHYLSAPLQEEVKDVTERKAIHEILLWVLNREEDFCTFDFQLTKNQTKNDYTLRMENFDAVTSDFLFDLCSHWGSLVKEAIVEWSSQAIILCVHI